MSAREEILARIRTALAEDDPAAGAALVPRAYRTSGELPAGSPAVLDLLAERIADYQADVHRAGSDQLPTVIARLTAARAVRQLVVPDDLPAALLAETTAQIARDVPESPLTVAELDRSDGVLTFCAVAIAETGTVVLDAGFGQGRRVLTLVPDYHLVVVRADQVVQSVPEALARLDPSRPLTWISGPSATSDIELERVEGVHGPRTLDVIVLDPSPAG